MSIAVIIRGSGAHAGLLASVLIEGDAGVCANVDKGTIMVVAIKDGGSGIAGDINIGPAIFIEVESRDRKAIMG